MALKLNNFSWKWLHKLALSPFTLAIAVFISGLAIKNLVILVVGKSLGMGISIEYTLTTSLLHLSVFIYLGFRFYYWINPCAISTTGAENLDSAEISSEAKAA